MSFGGLILTNIGRNKMAAAISEKTPLQFTYIQLGDGYYNGSYSSKTKLSHLVMEIPITSIRRKDDEVLIECDWNSSRAPIGFYLREIGIIGNGGLCYYDNAREGDAEFIDPESDVLIKQKRFRFTLTISSDVTIAVKISSELYALAEEVDAYQKENDKAVGGKLDKTGDGSDVTVAFDQAGTRENISTGEKLSTVLGKIAKFFADLKKVAFSGSYNDLTDKPTIPAVNNGILTIQKNGTKVQTFSANQSSNATADITVPTKVSELTNDSGYKTTDTNTWRGIQNNLTSDSTTESLSAAQGKVLKGIIDNSTFLCRGDFTGNIDTLFAAGAYWCAGFTGTRPVSCDYAMVINITPDGSGSCIQRFLPFVGTGNFGTIFERYRINGKWSPWRSVLSSGSKPADIGAAPAAHTHDDKIGFSTQSASYVNDLNLATQVINVEGADIGIGNGNYYRIINLGGYSGGKHTTQIAVPYQNTITDSDIYIRTGNGTAWRTWRKLIHDGNISSQSVSSASKLASSAGSPTNPIYFSNGKPVACSYALGKSVPSNAVFTDTNTWRGIQNNLTSTSTTDSLSAAQGKKLNDEKAPKVNPEFTGVFSHCRQSGTTKGESSVALGGYNQRATGFYSVAIGGQEHHATGARSACIGGSVNTASGENSACLGGKSCVANNINGACVGGDTNTAADAAVALGGNGVLALTHQIGIGHYNNITTAKAGYWTGTTDGTAFVIGNGTSSGRSNAFRVTYNGAPYAKSALVTTGCDYAEYFEWIDGNLDGEDRRGYFVTLDGKKIRKAEPGDWILGIVSGFPSIIGNGDEEWLGRYVFDEFGTPVTEEVEETRTVINENGEEETIMETVKRWKENPDYDKTRGYTERADRPEWDAVGMLGVLSVRDDGTCKVNGFCKLVDGGTATVAESTDGGSRMPVYRVINRVTDGIIEIIFK